MRRAFALGLALGPLWLVAAPLSVAGQEAETGPGAPHAAADSVRAAQERPPGEPPADWVDVLEFPLRVVGFPLNLVLVKFPAWLAATITAPRRPSFLVRAYRDLADWGLTPTVRSTIGPRSGAGLELQVGRWSPLYVQTAVSWRLSQRHWAGLLLGDGRRWLNVEAMWERDAELPWHGIGSETPEDRVFYRRDWFDAALRAGHRLHPGLSVDAGLGYENNLTADPVLADESLLDQPESVDLFGAGTRTEYVRLEVGGSLDLAPWSEFQQRGVLLGLSGQVYRGVGDTESDFHRLTGFAHGYLPLNRRQTLALRALTSLTRGDGGAGVPFYHLASLGGSRSSIGLHSQRFRDHDLLAFMGEWRYEVWRELHGRTRAELFLAFDRGTVAPRMADIGSEDWHSSYGVGLRIARPDGLLGVGYLGFSDEGVTVGARGSWVF